MDRGEVVSWVKATREVDLELATQALTVRVPQQVLGQRHAVGRHVERLMRAYPGVHRGGDVADHVAACLAGRHLGIREDAQQVRRLLQLHKVDLNVLARGEVGDAMPVDLGHIREGRHLIRRDEAQRQLRSHHVHAILALPIDAVPEPILEKDGLCEAARAEAADRRIEGLQLGEDLIT